MEIVWGGSGNPDDNRRMADWCAVRLWPGSAQRFGNCATMGVQDDGELLAVMVFHSWTPDHDIIEISGAADHPRWLSRRVLNALFAYPFDAVGVQAVVMRCEPGDVGLSRILPAIGFKRYVIPRLRGRDRAEAVFVLGDDDWRKSRFYQGD